jgi:hypothetical protein
MKWRKEDLGDKLDILSFDGDWIATVHGGRDSDYSDASIIEKAPEMFELLDRIVNGELIDTLPQAAELLASIRADIRDNGNDFWDGDSE